MARAAPQQAPQPLIGQSANPRSGRHHDRDQNRTSGAEKNVAYRDQARGPGAEKNVVEANAKGYGYICRMSLLGTKVQVTVVRTARAIDEWLQKIPHTEREFGLDIEFRPGIRGVKRRPATIQLATKRGCLIVQLVYLDFVPESLLKLLRDPSKELAGVGIRGDCLMLLAEYNVVPMGEVDLIKIAADIYRKSDIETWGLARLYNELFPSSEPFVKDKKLTLSDWTLSRLTKPQMKYAACDAWASYALLHRLNSIQIRFMPASPSWGDDPVEEVIPPRLLLGESELIFSLWLKY